MLFILLVSAISDNTIASIKSKIDKKMYNDAYKAAESQIQKYGMIDADPELFHLRGLAAFKLGKYEQAVSDSTKFINSRPTDLQLKLKAYSVRGYARLRMGELEDALIDSNMTDNKMLSSQIKSAQLLLNAVSSNTTLPKVVFDKYTQLLKVCPQSVTFLAGAANASLQIGEIKKFLDYCQRGLALSSSDARILEMMGQYYLGNADFESAKRYITKCVKVSANPAKCNALLKASNSFQSNEKDATKNIDKKDYVSAQENIDKCQSVVNRYSSDGSPLSIRVKKIQVKVLLAKEKKEEALSYLDDLIKDSPNNTELLLQRGEILMDLEDYDGAMNDFQKVRKAQKNNPRITRLIEKVSKLQEKEKNVDYYTVLGVKRGASMKEIKDAYRKAVIKWHPDRFKEPLKKKNAEKHMKMINRAYDVLGDEQKKKMYDLGQNPDDPGTPPPNEDNFNSNYNSNNFNGYQYYYTGGNQGNPNMGRGNSGFSFNGFDFNDILRGMGNLFGQSAQFQQQRSQQRRMHKTQRSSNQRQRNTKSKSNGNSYRR